MKEKAIECRRHAQECGQAAETARDKDTKKSFQKAEAMWSRLAGEIEEMVECSEHRSPVKLPEHDS